MNKKILLFILGSIFFVGCRNDSINEVEEMPDLQFFATDFLAEDSFAFDGFQVLDDYEFMEIRMQKTKVENEPLIREMESGGIVQIIVEYPLVGKEEYQGVTGSVTYTFINNAFAAGSMELCFPDFEDAKNYVEDRQEKLELKVKKDWEKEMYLDEYCGYHLGIEKSDISYSVGYVDKKDIYLGIRAYAEGGEGRVTLFLRENVDYQTAGRDKSIYFDFE